MEPEQHKNLRSYHQQEVHVKDGREVYRIVRTVFDVRPVDTGLLGYIYYTFIQDRPPRLEQKEEGKDGGTVAYSGRISIVPVKRVPGSLRWESIRESN